eukprot:TRINITY_DN32701_c0_g1_i1.p2 TRINITY_DN32701_c0_g1~~TRINITY_DN32701_c0_g1_i1.p2  ORF type:complete len:264 (+),score=104.70 TRINITY_DN32701_c0_g1_i1:46-837(+)
MEELVTKQLTNAVWRAEQAVTVVDDDAYEEATKYGFTVPRVASVDHEVLFGAGMDDASSRKTLRSIEKKQWRVECERQRRIAQLQKIKSEEEVVKSRQEEEDTIVNLKSKLRKHLSCGHRLLAQNTILNSQPREHCRVLTAITDGHHAKAQRYLAEERLENSRVAQLKKEKAVILKALNDQPLTAASDSVFRLDLPGLRYTCRKISEVRTLIQETNEERNRLVIQSRNAHKVEAEESELNFFKLKYKRLLGRGGAPDPCLPAV